MSGNIDKFDRFERRDVFFDSRKAKARADKRAVGKRYGIEDSVVEDDYFYIDDSYEELVEYGS